MSPPAVGSIRRTIPKPLERRPTLVRKRDDDVEETVVPSSPGKRLKASSDEDNSHTAPDLVQEEVRLAFDKRSWSDDSGYDKIKDLYDSKKDNKDEVSTAVLRSYTAALLSKVPRLNRTSSDLVHKVIQSQWLGREDDYVALFTKFLGSLVVQHGMYLKETIRMLVENLTSGNAYAYKAACSRLFLTTTQLPHPVVDLISQVQYRAILFSIECTRLCNTFVAWFRPSASF